MEEIRSHFIPWLVDVYKQGTEAPGAEEETSDILQQLKNHIDSNYKRPEGMYSKVRKLIQDQIPCERTCKQARNIIKMSRAEYEASTAAARRITEIKNTKQTVFTLKYITDVVSRVRKCVTFADRFVFLQLACGARAVELLDSGTSQFSLTDHPSYIRQSGFAKKRKDGECMEIVKPLLWTTSARFLRELSTLRRDAEERGHTTRREIAKSYSGQLVGYCKMLWFQHTMNNDRTGTHLNRSIYANTAYKHYGGARESLTHFVKHVLGHDTMGSAANYMNIAVAFENDEKLKQEAVAQENEFVRENVAFENDKGAIVSIPKPVVRKMTSTERKNDIIFHARELRANGIPVKRTNLIALGFQSKAIRKEMLDSFRV
jgi:hypothetical protein